VRRSERDAAGAATLVRHRLPEADPTTGADPRPSKVADSISVSMEDELNHHAASALDLVTHPTALLDQLNQFRQHAEGQRSRRVGLRPFDSDDPRAKIDVFPSQSERLADPPTRGMQEGDQVSFVLWQGGAEGQELFLFEESRFRVSNRD